jgi:hypothetical protein
MESSKPTMDPHSLALQDDLSIFTIGPDISKIATANPDFFLIIGCLIYQ